MKWLIGRVCVRLENLIINATSKTQTVYVETGATQHVNTAVENKFVIKLIDYVSSGVLCQ